MISKTKALLGDPSRLKRPTRFESALRPHPRSLSPGRGKLRTSVTLNFQTHLQQKEFKSFGWLRPVIIVMVLAALVAGCADPSANLVPESRPRIAAQNEVPQREMDVAVAAAEDVTRTTPVLLQSMPINQVAIFKERHTLGVEFVPPPGDTNRFPVWYQWQRNGNALSASSTNLSFPVSPEYMGDYSVTVSSAWGKLNASWNVTMTYDGSYIDEGTLAHHLSTNAVARVRGLEASYANKRFLNNWTSATYTQANLDLLTNSKWSRNLWLKGVRGLSATPIGIINNLNGRMLLTMVSPRHYLRSTHVGNIRGPIAFLDTNNIVHWRNAVQQVNLGNDLSLGILDADLPPTVEYLPVLPTNYTNWLPTGAKYVQGIGTGQNRIVFGQSLLFNAGTAHWTTNVVVPFGLETNWNNYVVDGDSSLPEYVLINDQLVLVSLHRSYNFGPNVASQFNQINERMRFLSTNNNARSNYQLTPISLEEWPKIR